ncbi:FG-GAP repeat domain-containing protein, partial [Lysobacter enzymogenes]|uniref:FG-GAP repeat domain-containing protein n=1 Tax=Lysobacter enzymogenes TaxID=69 RepID=UPI0019D16728
RGVDASAPTAAAPVAASAAGDGGYALTEGPRYRPPAAPGSPTSSGYTDFSSVEVGDVNGDGRADVVATTLDHRVLVFLQQAQGGLGLPPREWRYPGALARPVRLLLVDLNGDGAMDIVTERSPTNPSQTVPSDANVLLSDGQGGFLAPQAFPTGSSMDQWTGIDVDHDGRQDIVGIAFNPSEDCRFPSQRNDCWLLRVLYGDGRGGLRGSAALPFDGADVRIEAIRDFDGDGLRDVLYSTVTPANGTRRLHWLPQLAQGGFGPAATLIDWFPGVPAKETAFGDFDGDGRLDMLVASTLPDQSLMYLQSPNGGFQAGQRYAATQAPKSRLLADDFDGDGRTDLVSIRQVVFNDTGGEDALAYNLQRDGALAPSQWNGTSRTLHQRTQGFRQIDYGDFNGDGCLDVAAATSEQGLAFYYGRGCRQAAISSQDRRTEQNQPLTAASAAMVSPPAAQSPLPVQKPAQVQRQVRILDPARSERQGQAQRQTQWQRRQMLQRRQALAQQRQFQGQNRRGGLSRRFTAAPARTPMRLLRYWRKR